MLTLNLPYPPTMNTYWRHIVQKTRRGFISKVLISASGRKYRADIKKIIMYEGNPSINSTRIAIQIHVAPPDRRRRDLDNLLKPLLDALQAANVFADDFHIDKLSIERCEHIKGGLLIIRIWDMGDEQKRPISNHF